MSFARAMLNLVNFSSRLVTISLFVKQDAPGKEGARYDAWPAMTGVDRRAKDSFHIGVEELHSSAKEGGRRLSDDDGREPAQPHEHGMEEEVCMCLCVEVVRERLYITICLGR
jgi:hypothetical protein